MYDFLSLNVNCPVCSKSLMDDQIMVDNEKSIKLNIEVGSEKGTINLSSIYGSYNYITKVNMSANDVAQFSCPSCSGKIIDESHCLSCDAPMVPFHLDMGGKVSICSRNGCKHHKVEFDDLSIALNKLYQDYGLAGNFRDQVKKTKPKEIKKDPNKEFIESGSFLQAYCPHCKKSLIEDEQLKLKIKGDKEGYIMLSPYLNVYTLKSTINLPEDKNVSNLYCFHCNESLIEDLKCKACDSPTAKIAVGARTKLLDFYICTKKGCKWHGLSEKDYYDIRLEDSLEW